MTERKKPGAVRDAIIQTFQTEKRELTLTEVRAGVETRLGEPAPASSVRSYLNINTPGQFLRTNRGTYRLVRR